MQGKPHTHCPNTTCTLGSCLVWPLKDTRYCLALRGLGPHPKVLTDLCGAADQPAHHLPSPPAHGVQRQPHHLQGEQAGESAGPRAGPWRAWKKPRMEPRSPGASGLLVAARGFAQFHQCGRNSKAPSPGVGESAPPYLPHPYLQAQLQCNTQQGGVRRHAGRSGCLAGVLRQLEEQSRGVDILLDGAQDSVQPFRVS